MAYKEWRPGMGSPFEKDKPSEAELKAAAESLEKKGHVEMSKDEKPLEEATEQELDVALGALEHGKMAAEARGDEQRLLDESQVEEAKRQIEALGESPLDKLAEEAKKEENDQEKAA